MAIDKNTAVTGAEKNIIRVSSQNTEENLSVSYNSIFNKCIIPDGKIGDFKQGTGDCWFLATLANLGETPEGKKIISDTISPRVFNGKKGYKVTFNGGKEPVWVSEEEINKETITINGEEEHLAYGDADVKLLELAANKYLESHPNEFRSSINNGGHPQEAWMLLTGSKNANFLIKSNLLFLLANNHIRKNIDCEGIATEEELINKLESLPPSKLICKAPSWAKFNDTRTEKPEIIEEGKKINGLNLYPQHAYNIIGYDKKERTVTLWEPQGSTGTISYDLFCDNFTLITLE